jgi:hypothetical protein
MRKTMLLALIGASILLLSTVGPSSAQVEFTPGRVLPVKFVCGRQAPNFDLTAPAEPPVKPGNYATVINIENLTANADGTPVTIGVDWNVSVPGLTTPDSGGPITDLAQFATTDITCADIAAAVKSPNGFITGYVNIIPVGPTALTDTRLAVTAVYTAQGCNFPLLSSLVPGLPTCTGPVSTKVVPLGGISAGLSGTSS